MFFISKKNFQKHLDKEINQRMEVRMREEAFLREINRIDELIRKLNDRVRRMENRESPCGNGIPQDLPY